MNNYDAGITMDTFMIMPVYMGYMVKMSSILLSHPLELIRVNIQANVMEQRLSMRDIFKKMSRQGRYSFYYGVETAGMRCTINTLGSFRLFSNLREILRDSPLVFMLKPYDHELLMALCGFGGGILATPFAKLSVIRQSDLTRGIAYRRNYRTFYSGLKCMYYKGGLNYLFTGWRINAISNALVVGLHKPVSERVEGVVSRFNKSDTSWFPTFTCMALTGTIITMILIPIESVAIMALSRSFYRQFTYAALCRMIIRKHGFWGFFFGLTPGLIGLIPNTVLATVAYGLLLDYNLPKTLPDWGATSSGRSS